MSVYFVFTMDGDWDEYFHSKLPAAKRQPDKKTLLNLIKREIKLARSIKGKFLHFVHTSPVTRDFFLKEEFIALWKEIEARGGSVGVHCHEEDLYHDGYFHEQDKMEEAIGFLAKALVDNGLHPISYRGGYLAFCEKNVPILENNSISLDFSCDPDRYLWHKGELVADWRGSPYNYYRISYEDHRKPGKSNVIEIPLGKVDGDSLYIGATSLLGIWRTARALAKIDKEEEEDVVVSVLAHTYLFSSFWQRLKIKLALYICKKYGTFVNDREALEIINRDKEINNK